VQREGAPSSGTRFPSRIPPKQLTPAQAWISESPSSASLLPLRRRQGRSLPSLLGAAPCSPPPSFGPWRLARSSVGAQRARKDVWFPPRGRELPPRSLDPLPLFCREEVGQQLVDACTRSIRAEGKEAAGWWRGSAPREEGGGRICVDSRGGDDGDRDPLHHSSLACSVLPPPQLARRCGRSSPTVEAAAPAPNHAGCRAPSPHRRRGHLLLMRLDLDEPLPLPPSRPPHPSPAVSIRSQSPEIRAGDPIHRSTREIRVMRRRRRRRVAAR
jgi:hypothetical protein